MLELIAIATLAFFQVTNISVPAKAFPTSTAMMVATGPQVGGGAVPVTEGAPVGAPITGDLSGLRPSEQLRGRQQALRAHFQQQIHSGERPWIPVN